MTETVVAERPTIAVVCGGRSSEHEISCVTAGAVLDAIDHERYNVVLVGIADTGDNILLDHTSIDFTMNPDAMPHVHVHDGDPFIWPLSTTDHTAYVVRNGRLESVGRIDAVFPVLHGPWGEDGTLQGLFELIDLPYVGNGVLSSAACMDKVATKRLLRDAGIEVGKFVAVTREAWQADHDSVVATLAPLGYPIFVKPARAGSSVGVSKVSEPAELDAAIIKAFEEDTKLIIEAGVDAREIECGVLIGDDGQYAASEAAGEIVVHGHEFYDYEAKYLDPEAAVLHCPADLTTAQLKELHATALAAFNTLDCRGLARVDFFLDDSGFIVNEVNTMPGFTPRSMFPVVWEQSGVAYATVIERLLAQALLEPVRG